MRNGYAVAFTNKQTIGITGLKIPCLKVQIAHSAPAEFEDIVFSSDYFFPCKHLVYHGA